jgi:hypothetical protein
MTNANREEWRFLVCARRLDEEPFDEALVSLVLDCAVRWAERRGLGIGGGPDRSVHQHRNSAMGFQFGLCLNGRERPIPAPEARALVAALRQWGRRRQLRIDSSFEPYPHYPPRPYHSRQLRRADSRLERRDAQRYCVWGVAVGVKPTQQGLPN